MRGLAGHTRGVWASPVLLAREEQGPPKARRHLQEASEPFLPLRLLHTVECSGWYIHWLTAILPGCWPSQGLRDMSFRVLCPRQGEAWGLSVCWAKPNLHPPLPIGRVRGSQETEPPFLALCTDVQCPGNILTITSVQTARGAVLGLLHTLGSPQGSPTSFPIPLPAPTTRYFQVG